MKVQQVNNYTNQYSSNKACQATNNQNFGQFAVVDLKGLKPDGLRSFVRRGYGLADDALCLTLNPAKPQNVVIEGLGGADSKAVAALKVHINALKSQLPAEMQEGLQVRLIRRGDGVLSASVSHASQRRLGLVEMADTGSPDAAKVVAKSAFADFMQSARIDEMYDAKEGKVPAFWND